jgi:uncharacterized protein
MANAVRDNEAAHRYELDAGGATAFVTYRDDGPTRTLIHTEVPDALAGQGIGSALARGTLELARSRGGKLVVKCPFIAAFIGKHPEFQDLVAG